MTTNSARSAPSFTNHLAGESSRYLLAHAHNPVDWYPWGPEALQKAKELDRPIFLSIGYASCHWCHVMEHESFENDTIADILNRHFVSIKVDREQRPDLDRIYMTFTQALTGSGGWPMSVFLTSDLKPFFAGTYFPPDDRYGRPGFKHVLEEVSKAYAESRQSIEDSSKAIYEEIEKHVSRSSDPILLSEHLIDTGVDSLMQNVDNVHGGFGTAPKFPHPVELSLLLHQYKRTGDLSYLLAASKALKAMARGGINDQIGGGFARYSVDDHWLVPHFEKMLYDNALLVLTYSEAYQITGDTFYRDVVTSTLDFMLRDMADSTGGFYSSIDADSEGAEGKFYLWTKPQIEAALGSNADLFCRYFNVTDSGNFEGASILHIDSASDRVREESKVDDFDSLIEVSKARLLEVRSERVHPLVDDKILISWNGLALSALARGYQVTDDRRYLDAALANAEFVQRELFVDGKLTHSYRHRSQSNGEFLEDYAYYTQGLLDLYETDRSESNIIWLTFATQLADHAIKLFVGKDSRFYLRPENQADLIMRPREETDDALPAPGSVMVDNLIKLNILTGKKSYADLAENALKSLSGQMAQYPGGMASALLALQYFLGNKVDIVLVGATHVRDQMLEYIYHQFIPNLVIAMSPDGASNLPVFDGRRAYDHNAVAYVCLNSLCKLPATTLDELKTQLSDLK